MPSPCRYHAVTRPFSHRHHTVTKQVGSLRWLLEECCTRVPPSPQQIEALLAFGRSRASAALASLTARQGVAVDAGEADGWEGDDVLDETDETDETERVGAKFDVDEISISEYSERRRTRIMDRCIINGIVMA